MEHASIFFHLPLLAHHMLVNSLAAYRASTANSNNTSVEILTEYRFRFLTIWNFTYQTLYLTTSIVVYVLCRMQLKRTKHLQKKAQMTLKYFNIFMGTPTALYIVMLFWTLYTIDRELIFPSVLDGMLPPWINHSLHTSVLLLPIGEIFFQRKIVMPRFLYCFLCITAFYWVYIAVLFGTFWVNDFWIYPFLNYMSWPARTLFVVWSYTIFIGYLAAATMIHRKMYKKASNYSNNNKV